MKEKFIFFKERLFLLTDVKLRSSDPWHIMGGVLLYLLLSWSIWYFVDIRNWLGLRDLLIIKDFYGFLAGEIVPLWWFIFREAGPTELLQWTALAATSVGSLVLAIRLKEYNMHMPALFWRLISIIALLMFLEDAVNIRHVISYLAVYLASLDWSSTSGLYLRTFMELTYFGILALMPLYALLRYGRFIWHSSQSRNFLFIGYFFYGMAVAASGTRFIGEWYVNVGNLIYEFMLAQAKNDILYASGDNLPMGFWLMDFMVEESLELIGAGALLSATVAYRRYLQR